MAAYEKIKYAVYFNTHNKHVTIHKIPTPHILKIHGGEHSNEQGGYGYFVTRFEVESFANAISQSKNLPKPQYCKKCNSV